MAYNRFLYNTPLYNHATTGFFSPASSTDAASTRSPYGHSLVAVPGGDLVFIYQEGAVGLVYRVSTDGGRTWSIARVIDARTTVYPSAIINTTTLDIHVVYSLHGNPGTTDEGVFYRPLIRDAGAGDWNVGGEQTLAGDGGLYDPATAGRRNASISVGDDNFPVITYLRNDGGTVSWAMLISQETNAFTDFNVDLDIGVAADEDSRGALQQTTGRVLYFVSRTGSSYNIATATIDNPMVATGVDMTVLFSWFGAESDMVAVARNSDGTRLGIVYLAGDNAPHFRLYNLTTNSLVSDTEMDTAAADSVSITWDGAVFWLSWVANDVVEISNSDAPATVLQTFTNPGPDENWSWLNSAVIEVDSETIIFVWSETNNSPFNVYVGTFTAIRNVTVAETGAGTDAATNNPVVAETGSGEDSSTDAEVINQDDFSINQTPQAKYNQRGMVFNAEEYNQEVLGTELGVTAGPLVADTGVGVDAEILGKTEAETGVGVDVVTIGVSEAETGSGLDNADIPTELINTVDAGSGDGETASVRIVVEDTGVGVTTERVGETQAESGVGVDIAQILLGPEADTGSGADLETHGPTVTDTGQGDTESDEAAISIDKQEPDEIGLAVDVAQIELNEAETGSGADQAGAGQEINVLATDTGVGVDLATQTWIPTAVVVRLLKSRGEVRLKTES